MSKQSYFQKAILSELGISSWQLSEPSLIHSDFHPQTKPSLVPQAPHTSLDVVKPDLAIAQQTVKHTPSQETLHHNERENQQKPTQEYMPPIDVKGKILVYKINPDQDLPKWWWHDVLLALNADSNDVITLEAEQTARNMSLAALIIAPHPTLIFDKSALALPLYTLNEGIESSAAKQRLWQILQSQSEKLSHLVHQGSGDPSDALAPS